MQKTRNIQNNLKKNKVGGLILISRLVEVTESRLGRIGVKITDQWNRIESQESGSHKNRYLEDINNQNGEGSRDVTAIKSINKRVLE